MAPKSLTVAIGWTLKCTTFILELNCPSRSAPDHGSVLRCVGDYNGYCEMTCETGYELLGEARSQCVMSGSRVHWSNKIPECKGKKIRSLR